MHLLLTMTALPSSTDRATHGFPCDPSSKSFQPRGRATSSPAPIKPHSTNADTPTPSHQLSAAQLFHRTKPNLGLKPHLHNQPTPPTHTQCLSSLAAARSSRRSRRSHRPRPRLTWFPTCTAGMHPLDQFPRTPRPTARSSDGQQHAPTLSLTLTLSHAHATNPTTQSPQVVLGKVHRRIVPRGGSEQGRVGVPGPLRVQVLRGQRQGQREDAGRGPGQAGRRWHVWRRHVRSRAA
jgi:hypothetical protein